MINNHNENTVLILTVMTLGITLIWVNYLLFYLSHGKKQHRQISKGRRTYGVVLCIEEDPGPEGIIYRTEIGFRDHHDKQHIIKTIREGYVKNSEVLILYDPDDPEYARIEQEIRSDETNEKLLLYGLPLLLLIIWLSALV